MERFTFHSCCSNESGMIQLRLQERERSIVVYYRSAVNNVSKTANQDTEELTFHLHYKSGSLFSDEQPPYDDAWKEKQER